MIKIEHLASHGELYLDRDEAECLAVALSSVLGAKLTFSQPTHWKSTIGDMRVTDLVQECGG